MPFDDWYQPFRQFTLHYVIIHQPQDPLWHLGVSRGQNDRQAGKPLLDMACYGFRVYAFLFVLQGAAATDVSSNLSIAV